MKFTIVERKIKINQELRSYALKKVEKLDRYFQEDAEVIVTFTELKGQQKAEITVKRGGMIYRAEETTTDMFASIDGAITHLERQIRKHKSRLEKRLREGAFEKQSAQTAASEEDFNVVRRKQFEVKPMTVEEAILQMDLLNHQFFFFCNAENNNVHAVLYKRIDGGYGLIEGIN